MWFWYEAISLFSAHINGGGKSWSVTRFFLQILPKLHFISTQWSEGALHLLLSQPVGREFEPGLVLEFFCVSLPLGRGFDPLLRYTFFAISVSRKISRCLAGVLFVMNCVLWYLNVIRLVFHVNALILMLLIPSCSVLVTDKYISLVKEVDVMLIRVRNIILALLVKTIWS